MALSDRERQILSDIEAQLREDDPRLVEAVGTKTVSSEARRRVKFAAVGFVLGFVVMLFFAVNLWFGVAGFAIMLTTAVYGGQTLKQLGQQQTNKLGGQLREGFDRYFQDRRRRGELDR
ncbi:MAG: DUF3040 domain-containing protein [Actinobacteria bacterium]|nr:DUF3040 domain-containing protein [Actinomycetota bacterium]